VLSLSHPCHDHPIGLCLNSVCGPEKEFAPKWKHSNQCRPANQAEFGRFGPLTACLFEYYIVLISLGLLAMGTIDCLVGWARTIVVMEIIVGLRFRQVFAHLSCWMDA
jgi:hypothetical protein